MDTLIVTLAIRWLPATDAFAACCVCQEWQAALSSERDEQGLWKQVCYNTNPLAMVDLAEQTINFRLLALGLMDDDAETTAESEASYTPTLRPQDIFAVVELYRRKQDANRKRRKVIEASWVSELSFEHGLLVPDREILLKGSNPYSSLNDDNPEALLWRERVEDGTAAVRESLPHFSAIALFGFDVASYSIRSPESRLQIRATLFRRDTMKSICILDEVQFDSWKGKRENDSYDGEIGTLVYNNTRDLSFDSNQQGQRAKRLLSEEYDEHEMDCTGMLMTQTVLPLNGAQDEPNWLRNARRSANNDELYDPDEADMAVLRDIPYFQVQIVKGSTIELHVRSEDMRIPKEFSCQDDMMIALEGLEWR